MDYFTKIIGYEDIKKELEVVIDMILDPKKYHDIGAKMIKGVLLYGDPGTGKTTLINEVIDACCLPTFVIRKDKEMQSFTKSIETSFQDAWEAAPSIVFLDDMDKYSEFESKNSTEFVAIQSWMDKLNESDVLVLATANSIEEFPDSLLRAGRFDLVFSVNKPSKEDAKAIIRYYLEQKGISGDFDYEEVVRLLDGGSCAELASIINQASIAAAFENRTAITNQDIINAMLKSIYKVPFSMNSEDSAYLVQTAYHEAGHAVAAEILEPGSINIVSAVNSDSAIGGFVSYQIDKDYFRSMHFMENRVIALLAGKAANELVFGTADVGCSDDLSRAYAIVSRFVDDYCSYDFYSQEEKSYYRSGSEQKNRKEFLVSFEMGKYYQKAKKILIENRKLLDALAELVMEKKVITFHQVQELKNRVQKKENPYN